jgi:hypothetical protein
MSSVCLFRPMLSKSEPVYKLQQELAPQNFKVLLCWHTEGRAGMKGRVNFRNYLANASKNVKEIKQTECILFPSV